jgi:phosphatidylglycerophosphate synthase
MASIAAGALAGAAFWASAHVADAARITLLLLAALACQARLICNLMDGLVAIEAGKRAPDGAFWNEFPDRIADLLILAGLGLAAGAPALGWAAACMAVLTAYTRELGHACGAPVDFSGPMAKPHRMALVTLAALAAVGEELTGWNVDALYVALWALTIGAAMTTLRRASRIVRFLRQAKKP